MKIKNAAVVFLDSEKKAANSISKSLLALGISHSFVPVSKLHSIISFSRADIVLSVGGDGTFLAAAQKMDSGLILGVNPLSKEREGFFLRATTADFAEKIMLICQGRFKEVELSRLEAQVNGRPVGRAALNEIYFGAEKAYYLCRYKIIVNGKEEIQRSSGVIVPTAAGSHAWARSAGGKVLDTASKKMQFVVRELYIGKTTCSKIKRGFTKQITIIPEHNARESILSFDSIEPTVKIKDGDKIKIRKSKNILRMIDKF